MDDDFIEILDSNVHEILDVTIVEERIAEGSEVYFNDQQIKSHLTNLLYTNDSQLHILPKRVDLVFDIIKDVTKPNAPSYTSLRPLINATRITYFVNDDEYVLDADFEEVEQVKRIHFDRLLEQFHKLNRDVNNSYKVTSSKLYYLFRPFECSSDNKTKALSDVDVLDTKNRTFRILQSNNYYDGDDISIVGFYTGNGSRKEIDYDNYLSSISQLKVGDNVIVVFNDFVMDKSGAFCPTIEGTVEEQSIRLSRTIKFNGINTNNLKIVNENNDYFVFKAQYTPKFSKKDIVNGSYVVRSNSLKHYALAKEIIPATPSQALYIHYDNIKSLRDIGTVLEMYGFSQFAVQEQSRQAIDKILHVALPPSRVRVSPLSWIPPRENQLGVFELLGNIPGRTNIEKFANILKTRSLSNIISVYRSYIVKLNKNIRMSALEKKGDKLRITLSELESKSIKNSCKSTVKKVIAKRYTNIDQIAADDDVPCFWDKTLDKTDYSIKEVGDTQASLEKKLLTLPKFSNLNANDIRHEAQSILAGKRAVRIGEYAILTSDILAKTILYERKDVQSKPKWIRENSIDDCNDLMTTKNKINDETCFFNTYENACQSLKEARLAKKIARVKACIESIEYYKTNVDKLSKDLQKLERIFSYFKDNSILLRQYPFTNTAICDIRDIEIQDNDLEGYDIETTFEDLFNNVETQDMNNVAPMPSDKAGKRGMPPVNDDFIYILKNVLEVAFNDDQVHYMQGKLSRRYNVADLDKRFVKERHKLMEKVNIDLYNKNTEFRRKVDDKIEARLRPMITAEYQNVYYNIATYAIAIVTCMIMALYPSVNIERIIPKCSNKFSIKGYPLIDNASQSLESYIACALRFCAVPDDIKYKSLLEKREEEIRKDIVKHITDILDQDYGLLQSIKMNVALSGKKRHLKDAKDDLLHPSFKPNFSFTRSVNNSIITFLKLLNDRIQQNKYSRTTFSKSAYIANSCCPDKLTDNIDYYNMFTKDKEIQTAITRLPQYKVAVDTNIVYLRSKNPTRYKQLLGPMISQSSYALVNEIHQPFLGVDNDIDDDDTYNKVLLPRLSESFDKVLTILSTSIDIIDNNKMYFIRDHLIKGLNDNVVNTRNSLYAFVTNKMPLYIGRLKNKYRMQTTYNELYDNVVETLDKNNEAHEILYNHDISSLKNIPFFEDGRNDTENEAILIKNIASIMDVVVRILLSLLTASKDMNVLKVLSLVCNFILVSLYEYIDNTIYDIGSIEKKIENMRERRKELMMESYMADDEERSLQIQLRNIGVSDWSTIFERVKNADINAINNQNEENENYKMTDYQGENADDDIDEDTDFVR